MHHADLLIAASAAATDAEARARAADVAPPGPSSAAIEAVVATLLARAVAGKTAQHTARAFVLYEYAATDRRDGALAHAVADRLAAIGLPSSVSPEPFDVISDTKYTRRIYVDYADLADYAAREQAHRAQWLRDATIAWQTRATIAGTVATMPTHDGDVVIFTAPADVVPQSTAPRVGPLRTPEWTAHVGWSSLPVATVVGDAIRALRLPAWTLDAVALAWRGVLLANACRGTVERGSGLWDGPRVRQTPTLVFTTWARGDDPRPVTYAVDECYALTAADLAAKAAADLGLAPMTKPRTTGDAVTRLMALSSVTGDAASDDVPRCNGSDPLPSAVATNSDVDAVVAAGGDPTCGACAEAVLTGASNHRHTCGRANDVTITCTTSTRSEPATYLDVPGASASTAAQPHAVGDVVAVNGAAHVVTSTDTSLATVDPVAIVNQHLRSKPQQVAFLRAVAASPDGITIRAMQTALGVAHSGSVTGVSSGLSKFAYANAIDLDQLYTRAVDEDSCSVYHAGPMLALLDLATPVTALSAADVAAQ